MGNKETVEAAYQTKAYKGLLLPEAYQNYVKSKWMRSFRFGNDYMKLTESDAYYDAYETYTANVLNEQGTVVRLAALSDDPDVLLGFSVMTDDILHYVYVGLDYRMQGIARTLVPKQIRQFTHLTKTGLKLWPTKAPHAIFNPFA